MLNNNKFLWHVSLSDSVTNRLEKWQLIIRNWEIIQGKDFPSV